jgi:hypothetical protein
VKSERLTNCVVFTTRCGTVLSYSASSAVNSTTSAKAGGKRRLLMADPVGERTAVRSLRSPSHREAPDQARANNNNKRRSSARSAARAGVGGREEHAEDDSNKTGGDGKPLYACICGRKGLSKGFSTRYSLKRHIKESTEAPEHRCPVPRCRRMFQRTSHVQQHLRHCHDSSSPQQPRPAGTAAAAVLGSGSGVGQPGGAVTASATATAQVAQAGAGAGAGAGASWPGHFSSSPALSLLPAARDLEHVAPAFAPQSLTTQDQEELVASYYYCSAYPSGTMAATQHASRGLSANHGSGTPGGYPAALSGGDLGSLDLGSASVTEDGFGMTASENSFMGTFFDFGLGSFDV